MPQIHLAEPAPEPSGTPASQPPDSTGRADGLSLRQKLQISFFTFVLLLALVGYVSYRSINDVDDLVRVILQYDTKHIEISNEIRAKIFRINKNLEAFAYNWQQAPLTAVANELDAVRRLILRGQDLSNSGQVSRLLSMRDRINWEGLRELVETYQGLFSKLTEDMRAFAAQPGSLETTDAMLKLASELETLAVSVIDQAAAGPGPAVSATLASRATELRLATEGLGSSRVGAHRARAALDTLIALFKPLGATAGRPLSEARQKLTEYTRLFDEAERRLTRQAQLRASVEETLAQLARRGAGMEQLTSNLRTQNEAEAEAHRAEALELAAHVRSVVGQASVISLLLGLLIAIYIPNRVSMSLDQLLRGARRVGTGDLRWDIEVRDRDELAEVGHNFNLMRRNLAQLAERIQRSALKISAAANTILGTAEREKVAGSEQVRSINEISATVTELASSSSELNRNSIKVLDIVSMSSNTSQEGTTAISETLGAIQRISESNRLTSQKFSILTEEHAMIEQIMQTISDVADRTNLLALNAGIEAAKAGSQGKGFAVVASEVRRLADKTVLATQEIAGLINEIQIATNSALQSMENSSQQVSGGTEKVSRAGAMISHLNQNVQSILPQIEKMNLTIDRQAEIAFNLAAAIRRIQESVAFTQEVTSETAKIAREMNTMAGELLNAVQQFKLG
ncbi:MAG: MCP four helix bundle domain-containing protein [Candidatus Wallbacteria bacterium]|nr:MCP four helix bundle domain-containing protein [Candidatus Wallbacteria bacterium]